MFETLFSYSSVLRRHREGPLAAERAEYLRSVAARGMVRGTILRCARYCLCVAEYLKRWSLDRPLAVEEVDALALRWAGERVASGRASGTRWPAEHFRFAATEFLGSCRRLQRPSPQPSGTYDAKGADHAILLLLWVYGLRSGEVRRLCLDDIDWAQERMLIVRSKSGQRQ